MFDYAITTYELKNMLENGEVEREDLSPEQLDELERAEAEAERAEYSAAFCSYMREWQ